ncbi:MAG: BON domain-containing protein [Rhodopirellula sp.]|nr:BON domain-containing protein [Rhodopirellula sp.]
MLLSPSLISDQTQILELPTVPHLTQESEGVRTVERVSQALQRTGHLALRAINVSVHGSAVVIEGQVGSFYQKQVAQEAARKALPHAHIRNNLHVIASGHDRLRR